MTPEEKLAEEIKAKMSPEDIERLQSCTDEEAQKMLEKASVEIPLEMLDNVAGGDFGADLYDFVRKVGGSIVDVIHKNL